MEPAAKAGQPLTFALQPKVLPLDEPFGILDYLTRHELQPVLIEHWLKNYPTQRFQRGQLPVVNPSANRINGRRSSHRAPAHSRP